MLSRALPFFEMFMTQLTVLGEEQKIIKPWTDLAERWATKYYKYMDHADAYVISMCTFFYLYITSAANFNLQFLTPHYATSGSSNIGAMTTLCHQRKPFWTLYVQTYRDIVDAFLSDLLQMRKYHRLQASIPASTTAPLGIFPGPPARVRLAPTRFSVKQSEFEIYSPDEFTVEAEFGRYTLSTSAGEPDILRFWEVGGLGFFD